MKLEKENSTSAERFHISIKSEVLHVMTSLNEIYFCFPEQKHALIYLEAGIALSFVKL